MFTETNVERNQKCDVMKHNKTHILHLYRLNLTCIGHEIRISHHVSIRRDYTIP